MNLNQEEFGVKTVIKLAEVSKKFKIYHEKNLNFKYAVIDFLKGKKSSSYDEFWALRNISIDIREGESIGIIGSNGSGKSTVLKLIGKILYPDTGEISTKGKIATMIELGAGFHPELSGRENIYINAAILGCSKKEIDAKLEEIIAFSELEKFIDNPIKSYSSGMHVRLGFAVAINVNPDIMLTDEILAVGDENFQKKCLTKMEEFKKAGKTIVFVSHDLGMIEKICDRVFLVDDGELIQEGNPMDVISEYHRVVIKKNGLHLRAKAKKREISSHGNSGTKCKEETAEEILESYERSHKRRWGTKEVEIIKVSFLEKDENVFRTGEKFKIRIDYFAHSSIKKPVFGIAIHSEYGINITGPNTKNEGFNIEEIEGKGAIEYIVEDFRLLQGKYLLTVGIFDFSCLYVFDFWEKAWSFHLIENNKIGDRQGLISIPCIWKHYSIKE